MSSKLVEQIIEVVKGVSDQVFSIIDKEEDLSIEKLDGIITETIKSVAVNNRVEESTVRAAVTRRIDTDMQTFRTEIKDFIFGKREPLINRIIDNRAETIDSPQQIRNELGKI
ncbi:hypothetical protein [Clostridium algidicarnis]|uniref:hypothetical protein n=1 Tax=Clostridium algidicarnis TaxID=37659 RepID=UPI003FD86084